MLGLVDFSRRYEALSPTKVRPKARRLYGHTMSVELQSIRGGSEMRGRASGESVREERVETHGAGFVEVNWR